MDKNLSFQIAGGSVTGTDHSLPGKPGAKNNHDAFLWKVSPEVKVAIVCDGCGSGAHSEVGAKLGAELISQIILNQYIQLVHYQPGAQITRENFWLRVKKEIVNQLTLITGLLGPSLTKVVNDYFLFTFVGVLITPETTYIFSVGDGLYCLNGDLHLLGPFINNAPPYFAYNLTGSNIKETNENWLDIQINEATATSEVKSILIATDGAEKFSKIANQAVPGKQELIGPLSQFWEQDFFFDNPDQVRRRLNIINRETVQNQTVIGGPLKDDTTLIVIRRKVEEGKS
ncbi:MAG: protein phosphatase 2C domain-containing protein [Candidatus Falkowbacteria bacterium]